MLGEPVRILGYALAGALLIEAEGEGVARAWSSLPADTSLVVLTPAALRALGPAILDQRHHALIVTMPA